MLCYVIINVQHSLVITFEFTGAARGFMIVLCGPRGQKGGTALH